MRYSRLLEENSFSNRRADYVFLLLLCAAFLLVSLCELDSASELASLMMTLGYCPAPHYAIPLVLPRLLIGVYLVTAEPIDQDEPLWGDHVRPLYLGLTGYSASPADSISITAPYLPLCLVAFSWLLQGGFQAAIGDIVSLAVLGLDDGERDERADCVGRNTSWAHLRLPARLLAQRNVEPDRQGRGANTANTVSIYTSMAGPELIFRKRIFRQQDAR